MQREPRARRERRTVGGIKQLPWRTYRNPYKPVEVLHEEQIERIHDASMRILEEFGIEFLDAQARERAIAKGAELVPGTQRLRFDRNLVAEYVSKAPSEFVLHARVPERNLTFGANHVNFGSVASAPNVSGLANGARPGHFNDYCNPLKL